MGADGSRTFKTAGDVLDSIREQLQKKPADDMKLLLKLFNDISNVDDSMMSVRDAVEWKMREMTKREQRLADLQGGLSYRRGLNIGLFAGLLMGAVLGATIYAHL